MSKFNANKLDASSLMAIAIDKMHDARYATGYNFKDRNPRKHFVSAAARKLVRCTDGARRSFGLVFSVIKGQLHASFYVESEDETFGKFNPAIRSKMLQGKKLRSAIIKLCERNCIDEKHSIKMIAALDTIGG